MGHRISVLREIYLSLTNYPGQLSLAIPPSVGAMSTGLRALMLCGWGVKAGMARVWWQVELSALEAKLLRLCVMQIHDYFTSLYYIGGPR